ncbi:type II toxin-antitoxin system VapC family toxin, partial [Moraxella lacunata]
KPSLSSALKIIQDKGIYEILPITQTHILNLQTLEFHHKDPFDRMIISQAMCEHLTVLTVDSEIVKYPIECIS